jgi:hypothetical protein
MFQNIKINDFHLKPGSPAIDSGIDLNYTMDFDGNKVPHGSAPDIGAFEYTGNSTGAPIKRK